MTLLLIAYYHIKNFISSPMGKQKTAAVGSEERHDTADAGKKGKGTLSAKTVTKESTKQSNPHDAKPKSKADGLASKKPAAGGSEIDDIFGAAKKKATDAKLAEKRKIEEIDKVCSVDQKVVAHGGLDGCCTSQGLPERESSAPKASCC